MIRRSRLSIDLDLMAVEAQLEVLKRRDQEFQEMLASLQRMKEEIVQERQELQLRRSELVAQKEPINWLPPEVLTQVFLAFNEYDFEDVNYRPSVAVSHVCKRWRAVALASQPLWSRIFLRGLGNVGLVDVFLSRSGLSPLEITYRHKSGTTAEIEVLLLREFFASLRPSISRVRSLYIECAVTLPFASLLDSFQQHRTILPRIQSLSLAVITQNPSFEDAPVLLQPSDNPVPADGSTAKVARWTRSLRHLKLKEIPLFNFPSSFYANITTLEISYSPKKPESSEMEYFLKASTLCQFLADTPLLQNLVILDTVPFWDVTIPIRNTSINSPDQPSRSRYPIPLHHLKTLDWTYPQYGDLQRLLNLIDTPKLEKLDLWVDDQPRRPGTTGPATHAPGLSSRKVLTLSHLTDFGFQCASTDSMVWLLHKLLLPALERAEFTNVDPDVRSGSIDGQIAPVELPPFPRLESIFRDPRLPNLTHLTLSHYTILPDNGRPETILGYMPALTSLSLDSCFGVGKLITGFQEKVVGYISRGGSLEEAKDDDRPKHNTTMQKITPSNPKPHTRMHRIVTVKSCPQLEALSFWNCHDLDIDCLRAVIRARNEDVNPAAEEGLRDPGKTQLSQGRNDIDKETPGFSGIRVHNADDNGLRVPIPSVRKIKPLRRRRHQPTTSIDSDNRDAQALVPDPVDASDAVTSGMALKQSPAKIIFLRVSDCKLLKREDVLAFREFDVLDILWSGSD